MKSFIPYFKENFYQKLLTPAGNNPVRDRASGFLKIFEELEARCQDFYTIIETGCMRADHGSLAFGDDGCSTYLFDEYVNFRQGEALSIDINKENCDHANRITSPKTFAVCNDSVKELWSLHESIKPDLIYLDSFDLERGKEHLSQLHHLKELCAVMKNTQIGTLIAVDDNNVFGDQGKANYVTDFMKNIGAEILHDGYQIVFKL